MAVTVALNTLAPKLYICLSGDTKPTSTSETPPPPRVGDRLFESDTGHWFIWTASAWVTLTTPILAV